MAVHVGTSGWAYADWRTGYFAGVPQRRWYETVIGDFGTVELNVSFYRLPRPEVFAGWLARAPIGAVVAVKMSRYLTHVRRLADPAEPVARLLDRARSLGPALGPVLVQLPPDLPAELEALASCLSCFPRDVKVAVEPRHPSWWTPALRRLLETHDAALVWADRRGPVTPLWQTASWGYVRFHEGTADPAPRYDAGVLQTWAEHVADLGGQSDVFAYFNNDPGGAATIDAHAFRAALRRLGVEVATGPTPLG